MDLNTNYMHEHGEDPTLSLAVKIISEGSQNFDPTNDEEVAISLQWNEIYQAFHASAVMDSLISGDPQNPVARLLGLSSTNIEETLSFESSSRIFLSELDQRFANHKKSKRFLERVKRFFLCRREAEFTPIVYDVRRDHRLRSPNEITRDMNLIGYLRSRREDSDTIYSLPLASLVDSFNGFTDVFGVAPAVLDLLQEKPCYCFNDSMCGICLSNYKVGEFEIELPCSHSFHGECIKTWLVRNGTCPLCRADINLWACEEQIKKSKGR